MNVSISDSDKNWLLSVSYHAKIATTESRETLKELVQTEPTSREFAPIVAAVKEAVQSPFSDLSKLKSLTDSLRAKYHIGSPKRPPAPLSPQFQSKKPD